MTVDDLRALVGHIDLTEGAAAIEVDALDLLDILRHIDVLERLIGLGIENQDTLAQNRAAEMEGALLRIENAADQWTTLHDDAQALRLASVIEAETKYLRRREGS